MNKRIWELDALRGLCLLGVMAIHLIFDMTVLFPILQWQAPDWFAFLQEWGGTIFLVLSGICITLGRHPIRRGLLVFGGGMLFTAVTWGMHKLGFAPGSLVIRFGVLHCLGICMLLWCVLRHLPTWAMVALGCFMVLTGLHFATLTVQSQWLFPLGLMHPTFASGDYFPLLPHLGFFLLGAAIGRTLYRRKKTLFPKVNTRIFPINALQFIGRHSLWFYLLHQPVLAGICYLLTLR